MKILLDTNFVVSCVKQKIDFINLAEELFDEKIEWVVLEGVLEELKKISERAGEKIKDRKAAKFGIEIIKNADIKIIKSKCKNVDDAIIDYAANKKIVIATLDKQLKKRVKNKILTIRKGKTLEIY